MPQNGSRHSDGALSGASSEDSGDRARGEGDPSAPGREAAGTSETDSPSSTEDALNNDTANTDTDMSNADIPNVFEGLSPDLTTSTSPADEVLSLMKERDDLLDTLRRNQADFENYKKRIERQSQELRDRANERLVGAMLPALDAFALARAHLSEADVTPETQALLQAAALFEDALKKEGLERIVAEGAEFDPASHEAVEHVSADAGDANASEDTQNEEGKSPSGPIVVGVLRPGYVWKGRVIRPAMVRVRG
jgi:molecular chaperone GrpE